LKTEKDKKQEIEHTTQERGKQEEEARRVKKKTLKVK
jgi:hypothetical protein